MTNPIRGYKAFNSDFTCLGFQYHVGDTYNLPLGVNPVVCKVGFHFCKMPLDCERFYKKGKYAEILAWNVVNNEEISCAGTIQIVREIPSKEWELMSGCFTTHTGTKKWYQDGKIHRDNDLPAIEYVSGRKDWYQQGKLHRVGDHPAVIYPDGFKSWYIEGIRHRDGDQPAFIFPNGYKEWYTNGVFIKKIESGRE